jgi:ADP-heptose:LPS heptosyltransferase
MRILFVRLRSLGDAVLATPTLAAAKAAGAHVALVLEKPFSELFQEHPYVDLLLDLKPGSLLDRLRLIARLRRMEFELAVDLHGGTTSGIITWLAGAHRSAGYAGSRLGRWFDIQVPDPCEVWGRRPLHTVEYQLAVLRHLGFEIEPVPPLSVVVDRVEAEAAASQLAALGVGERFVLVHPAAALETKQWLPERFGAVVRELANRGRQVVVTAGPGQQALVDQVVAAGRTGGAAANRVLELAPQPLRRFAALAQRCELYLGNDTGTTHLAAALGRPVVVVFGSSNRVTWRPWGTEAVVVGSNRACIPCPGYRCLHYPEARCIRDVGVEQVLEAVAAVERRQSGGGSQEGGIAGRGAR